MTAEVLAEALVDIKAVAGKVKTRLIKEEKASKDPWTDEERIERNLAHISAMLIGGMFGV